MVEWSDELDRSLCHHILFDIIPVILWLWEHLAVCIQQKNYPIFYAEEAEGMNGWASQKSQR